MFYSPIGFVAISLWLLAQKSTTNQKEKFSSLKAWGLQEDFNYSPIHTKEFQPPLYILPLIPHIFVSFLHWIFNWVTPIYDIIYKLNIIILYYIYIYIDVICYKDHFFEWRVSLHFLLFSVSHSTLKSLWSLSNVNTTKFIIIICALIA